MAVIPSTKRNSRTKRRTARGAWHSHRKSLADKVGTEERTAQHLFPPKTLCTLDSSPFLQHKQKNIFSSPSLISSLPVGEIRGTFLLVSSSCEIRNFFVLRHDVYYAVSCCNSSLAEFTSTLTRTPTLLARRCQEHTLLVKRGVLASALIVVVWWSWRRVACLFLKRCSLQAVQFEWVMGRISKRPSAMYN